MMISFKWHFIPLVIAGILIGSFISFIYLKKSQALPSIEVNQATSTISVNDAVHALIEKYAYGPGVTIGAIDDSKILFASPHETEGCNRYSVYDLKTKEERDTDMVACPKIPVSESYPFYIEDCSYYPCYDFKTLYVTNLLTMERKSVYVVATTSETTIKGCYSTDYDPVCNSDISYNAGELSIPIYKARPRKAFELYENESLRTDTVNLYDVFGFVHP